MNLFEQVQSVISTTMKVSLDKISKETSNRDLAEWDSLAHMNLMMSLEQTFGLFLEVEDFPKLASVPAIIEYLREQGKV